MEERFVSRRTILRGLAGGLTVAAAMPLLAACGDDDDPTPTTAPAADPTPTQAAAEPTATDEPEEAEEEEEETPTEEAEDDPTATSEAEPSPTEASADEPSLDGQKLVVYSGRNEALVDPIIQRFAELTGADVQVQYAGTAELAATILEEGNNSPADVFFAQDAGALGAIAKAGMFADLPDDLLDLVEPRFRDSGGQWIGLSGRARAVVYNTDKLTEADIPASVLDFTNAEWEGRVGWAPTNASLQTFVTLLRVVEGEDVAREWLEGMAKNGVVFSGNGGIVDAVAAGEIDAGLVNHYYLYPRQAEAGGTLPAANYIYRDGSPGALVNVAGAGILTTAPNPEAADAFMKFMMSEEAQVYFAEETYEYPLVAGVPVNPDLVPLEEIQTPDVDLSQLDDLEGTLALMTEVGVL